MERIAGSRGYHEGAWPEGVKHWTIELATGERVTGAIQGCGGLIGTGFHNADRIRGMIINATRGRPTHVFEPTPGHCRMYPNATTRDAGDHVDVDLRGAKLITRPQ